MLRFWYLALAAAVLARAARASEPPSVRDLLDKLQNSYRCNNGYRVAYREFFAKDVSQSEQLTLVAQKVAFCSIDGRVLIDSTNETQALALGTRSGAIYANGVVVSFSPGKPALRQDVGALAAAMCAPYAPSHMYDFVAFWCEHDPQSACEMVGSQVRVVCPKARRTFSIRTDTWTVVRWTVDDDQESQSFEVQGFQGRGVFTADFPSEIRIEVVRAGEANVRAVNVIAFEKPVSSDLPVDRTNWWSYAALAHDASKTVYFGPGDVPIDPANVPVPLPIQPPTPGIDAMIPVKTASGTMVPAANVRTRAWVFSIGFGLISIGIGWKLWQRMRRT